MVSRSMLKHSTSGFVYESVRNAIMSLELRPGTNISEKEISEELKVSRTPVREAFLRLSEDELLTVIPQRGSYVTLIDLDHVEEARFLREQVEAGIIRLACGSFPEDHFKRLKKNLKYQNFAQENDDEEELFQLDKEFHRLLAEGTNKLRVWEVVQKMSTHSHRVRKLSIDMKLNWSTLVKQHEKMAQAIECGNSISGEQIIREHLSLLIYDQNELKEKYPNFFDESESMKM